MKFFPNHCEIYRPFRLRINFFLLSSMFAHAVIFYAFSQEAIEFGIARNTTTVDAPRLLEARIIFRGNEAPSALHGKVGAESMPNFAREFQPNLHPPARPDAGLDKLTSFSDPGSVMESGVEPSGLARAPHLESAEEYALSGRLTSLPTPLADIDLNTSSINSGSFAGKTELTLLIGANGIVDEVITASEPEEARAFLEQVAVRFKNTRFKPGEIDGRAVKSRLQVTIISEIAR
jgi:hypothetical protein